LLGFLFNHADEPWGGGPATVGRARYGYAAPFRVNSGATVRVVAEMSHTPRVSAVIPGGQSGHPLSPNYADQFPGWLEGELHPVATAPEEATAGALVLNPIPIPEPKTEHNR
jgi:penicillin amidase